MSNSFSNKKNIFFQFIKTGSSIVSQFLLVPVFLFFWDLKLYGLWISIIAIPNLLIIGNNCLIGYSNNLLIINYNRRNTPNIKNIYNHAFYLSMIVILILIFAIFFFNSIFDLRNFFDVNIYTKFEISLIILFVIIKLLFDTLTKLNLIFFKADKKLYFVNIYQTFFIFLEFLLIIIFLYFGAKILTISILSAFVYFISFTISFVASKKYYKYFHFKLSNLNLDFFKKLIFPSLSFSMPILHRTLIFQGTIILIGILYSEMVLVFFNLLRLFFSSVKYVLAIISNVYETNMTILLGKKDFKGIKDNFIKYLKIIIILSFLGLTLMLLIGKPLFLIWSNAENIWNQLFYILFLFSFFIEWIITVIQTLPYALNKPSYLNKIYLLNILVYYLTVFCLINYLYIYSLPISFLICNVVFLFFAGIKVKKLVFNYKL